MHIEVVEYPVNTEPSVANLLVLLQLPLQFWLGMRNIRNWHLEMKTAW